MNLNDLKERYSIKKFDPDKKLSKEQIDLLIDTFHLCPSSINIQAWKMIVVGDNTLKNKIAGAGKRSNKQCIEDCSHVLIFMRRKIDMPHIHSVIETTPIFGKMIKKMNLTKSKLAAYFWFSAKIWGGNSWVTHQLYLAMGFILAGCAQNKIGALPMEGIYAKKIDKLLKEPSLFKTVAAIAIGYPHIDDIDNPSKLQKARLPKELVTKQI